MMSERQLRRLCLLEHGQIEFSESIQGSSREQQGPCLSSHLPFFLFLYSSSLYSAINFLFFFFLSPFLFLTTRFPYIVFFSSNPTRYAPWDPPCKDPCILQLAGISGGLYLSTHLEPHFTVTLPRLLITMSLYGIISCARGWLGEPGLSGTQSLANTRSCLVLLSDCVVSP